ncbi:hypothetical protein TspCOW1_21720 [Thiohalobacter sp. COW1]|uniref:hypothetical protein n=1 Tax=Thiohalobacter sp. COW1 TaxID=2795687 RepID=UPI0019164725|nr:hypothetical protein [Thiohalobacter sp. COW1]BCO32069.1 hypothetical protein TspCOW1_21720 [Thiohalobacter sp. COW1]
MSSEIDTNSPEFERFRARLEDKYGQLLDTKTLARVLGYESANSLTKLVWRGRAPIPMVKAKGRRSPLAHVDDVAEYLWSVKAAARENFKGTDIEAVAQ